MSEIKQQKNAKLVAAHPPELILTAENIDWNRRVLSAGKLCLPLQQIKNTTSQSAGASTNKKTAGATNKKDLFIAYLDSRLEDASRVGSFYISKLLALLQPELVIQPPSSKSVGMINSAIMDAETELGYSLPSFTLLGGTSLNTITSQLDSEGVAKSEWPLWYQSYTPITGVEKHIGLTPSMLSAINEFDWKNICLVDDVYSSGATTSAMRVLIGRLLKNAPDPAPITLVAVAIEYEPPYNDQLRRDALVLAGMALPVVAR